MPEASGRVHWVGTGLSTGSGLRVLCERAAGVTVWGRTTAKAAACLSRVGAAGQAAARAYDPAELAGALRPGDVVVSMLPAGEHPAVLRMCVQGAAHFACSSYVSAGILDAVPAAEAAGTVVLAEAGLDPGLDHVLAHLLVERARVSAGTGPAVARFTSYCGGLPAVPNDFRYRFSWAPEGVLNALRTPARFIEGGVPVRVERPWEATRALPLRGEEFEAYPNRDSVPFVGQYGFPAAWQVDGFVRGTLRLHGWKGAWAGVFDELRRGDDDRIATLARELAARYPTTVDDRDRVVLAVALTVGAFSGGYLLDVVGDERESAMARCVSLPLACGVLEILAGALPAGLHRAAESAAEAARWHAFLAGHGLEAPFQPALAV